MPQEQIKTMLVKSDALLTRAVAALGKNPSNVELQRAFSKLVGERDQLAELLANLLIVDEL